MKARRQRHSTPLRIFRLHGRLLLCAATTVALFLLLPAAWGIPKRLVVGWDVGAALYLAFAVAAFARFDLERVRKRAAEEDEGAIFILMLTVAAAMASLGAIVALLGAVKDSNDGLQVVFFVLAGLTIVISWFFIHVIFAFHYAHQFYGGGDVGRGGGLSFPGEKQPDYWDFAYFSFVIGMTFQVSDVQITGRRLRRLVIVHGIVSFFFSVAILALAVNIGSQLIS